MYKLRTYQKEAVKKGLEVLKSKTIRKEVLVLPTAAGKSIVIAKMVEELKEPTLILQPSKELLEQNYDKYINVGGTATIYSASLNKKELSTTIFATIGSIKKEVTKLKEIGIKTIIIDEVHIASGSGSQLRAFIKNLGIRNVVGLTATPLVLNSSMGGAELKMLTKIKGKLFTDFAYVSQIQEMVENKYWSPLKYKVVNQNQSKLKVNTSGSDFTEQSLQEFFEENNLSEQIEHFVKLSLQSGRKSILVFVPTISEANALAEKIEGAYAVSSKSTFSERKFVIDNFKSGSIQVVINVGILTTGFDHPELDTIILARSTMSFTLYYQMLGRGVRIHPNKDYTLVVDLSENCNRFGKVENYSIEYIEGYGWGLFRGDNLMSNTPIVSRNRPKKYNLGVNKKIIPKDYTFTFGKYKGKEVIYVLHNDLPYIHWLLENFEFRGTRLQNIKKEIIKYLGI